MHAQYPIYLSSNFKSHEISSDVEPESNLGHQLKKDWRDICVSSPQEKEITLEKNCNRQPVMFAGRLPVLMFSFMMRTFVSFCSQERHSHAVKTLMFPRDCSAF